MELRPGYKQTEVGVIPEEWDVVSLGNLAELTSSKRIFESDYVSNGIPFFRGKEISLLMEGKLVEEPYFISERKFSEIKAQFGVPVRGDILVTAVGTLGNVFVVEDDAQFYFKDGNLIWLRKLHSADPDYVAVQLRARKADILNGAIGSSQKALTIVVLRDFRIPCPSPPEQRAITGALRDVDALLSGLDRLIAKKRDLKQAAMQQLLTGQTRLPGFSGEWEMKRLAEVADTDPENLGSNTPRNYRFKYISLEDVDEGRLKSHSEQEFATAPSRARRKLRNDDVLVSTVRPSLRSHLLFCDDEHTWVCSTGFCVVRCRFGLSHPGYIFFQMFGHSIARQIDALLTGSNYPAINSADVRALEIPFPDFPEQEAIAAVLSDMDAEIAALEQRRDKTRALKQAMMQELLRGRTRLVQPEKQEELVTQ